MIDDGVIFPDMGNGTQLIPSWILISVLHTSIPV